MSYNHDGFSKNRLHATKLTNGVGDENFLGKGQGIIPIFQRQ